MFVLSIKQCVVRERSARGFDELISYSRGDGSIEVSVSVLFGGDGIVWFDCLLVFLSLSGIASFG